VSDITDDDVQETRCTRAWKQIKKSEGFGGEPCRAIALAAGVPTIAAKALHQHAPTQLERVYRSHSALVIQLCPLFAWSQ